MQDQGSPTAVAEAIFEREFPVFAKAIPNAWKLFGDPWRQRLDETLGRLFPTEEELAKAIEGYAKFALEAMLLHKKFERSGVYDTKSYADAVEEVYRNEEYMTELYLPGILLSHFLWQHHYRQRLYFESLFLVDMAFAPGGRFCEVGIGTGYYSRLILQAFPDIQGTGYDISPHSGCYTRNHLKAFGLDNRFDIRLQDVVAQAPEETWAWVVSVEVLEHLEDPVSFLKALRGMLAPEGRAFVTAALNAPNADHIYLYRNPSEVVAQLNEAGFLVEHSFFASAYEPPGPEIPVPEVAAFVVK